MAIGFPEWNQRNSDTERRTFWPNLCCVAAGSERVPLWLACLATYTDCIRAGYRNHSMAIDARFRPPSL
jgi:hypothetical protein